MSKGLKRICMSCGTRFYDLDKSPIICPSCNAVFTGEEKVKARRGRVPAADTPVKQAEKSAAESDDEDDIEDIDADDDIVSLDDVDEDDDMDDDDDDLNLDDDLDDELDGLEDDLDDLDDEDLDDDEDEEDK